MRARVVLAAVAALMVLPVSPALGVADVAQSPNVCRDHNPGAADDGPNALLGVEFSSTKTGWAAGGNRVVRTTDAGAHWAVSYRRVGAKFFQLDAYNDSDAWVLGARGIARTTDGGSGWHWLAFQCQAITSIDFYSPLRGIGMAGQTLLSTTDGGQHWTDLSSPSKLQSACLANRNDGWAGAHGQIYRTVDGGRVWKLAEAGPNWSKSLRSGTLALVECAGPSSGWAELDTDQAGMNQSEHVGYHLSTAGSKAIFAESYFAAGDLKGLPSSPGPEPETFSAISPTEAAYVDFCGPCGEGASDLEVFTDGTHPGHDYRVHNIVGADAAAFLSATDGWVVGSTSVVSRHPGWRIEHTADGGKTWTTQYQQ